MERLWTPWRMTYIGASQPAGCFLCAKTAEDRDQENLIVYRSALGFVLLNLYPYNTGHLMVAPFLHTADLAGLPADVGADLLALTQRSVAALTEEYRPDGFNIGMNLGRLAGAGVPDHLHVHVVPRWGGDTNFMPVTADTKVLPESLDQTYRRLRPYFDAGGRSHPGAEAGE
jgi:ATP adenylyltransferase